MRARALPALQTALAFLVVGAVACSPPPKTPALDEMDRARVGPSAQEGASLAPEVYAHAEQERGLALKLHASGDEVAAELHANRAMAAYGRALAVARLARATTEGGDAQKAGADATLQLQALEASRGQLERDAEELERRVRVAEERLLPAPSAKATAEREAARLVAARSLAVEARLLCGATKLVKPDAVGLADLQGDVAKLEEALSKGAHPVPIDDAARDRARCLDLLTRARRDVEETGATDALLSELSAAGQWSPSRDERGVVVTLHDAFRGAELTDDAAAKLKELARVATAHAAFAVQVVVHDAQARPAKDTTDEKRAGAAVQAIVSGGAAPAKVQAEIAGTAEPLVDPTDAKARPRNERLEVTFVASGR